MVIYMLGNIGTHKSTYARYIADKYNCRILDDDELYYVICNKNWDNYYDDHIQQIVTQGMNSMINAACYRGQDIVIASGTLSLETVKNIVATYQHPSTALKVIVTGNGDRIASLENRKNNSRGCPQEEWAFVYDREATKIAAYLEKGLDDIVPKKNVLLLKNTLNEEQSKAEIDKFVISE